ncbi:MAG TPA: DUF4382 domain-containing protein, partial [Candidatus Acidoferrales bacterium]|nr:DUF4382 domain-containing protein [Candidatus Acidoferrales bacterium]
MYRKWTFKYSFAAVISAIAIIAVALLATPGLQIPTVAAATFTVMMTDPPTVPDGTTVLNLTYTDIALHITYPNGTTQWQSLGASGTVNLFSLINVTQTIATTNIPLGSTVDKLQFVIQDVTATVNGV